MTVIGEAFVAVRPDTHGFGDETEKSVLGSVASIAKKAAVIFGSAFVVKKGFDIGREAIAQASDLSETVSKIKVVFGDAASSVLKFGDGAALSIGEANSQALEAAGTFGNLLRSVGLNEDQSAKFSTSLVQLAGDLASFNNVSADDALQALQSGLVGETEPLKKFGVNLNEATLQAKALELGLVKGKAPLDANAKAQAAYALIMEQTSLAQGDFARTSSGLANQQRIFSARLTELKGKLGAVFLPAATAAFGFLNTYALPAIEKVSAAVGSALPKAFAKATGALKPIQSGFKQVLGVITKRDFKGGVFAEDSPFINGVFKVRDAVVRFLPVVKGVLSDLVVVAERAGAIAGPALAAAFGALDRFVTPALVALVGNIAGHIRDFVHYLASPEGDTALKIILGLATAFAGFTAAEAAAGKVNGFIDAVKKARDESTRFADEIRTLAENLGKITNRAASVVVNGAKDAAAAAKSVADELAKIASKSVNVSAKAAVDVSDGAKKGAQLAQSLISGFAGAVGGLLAGALAAAIGSAGLAAVLVPALVVIAAAAAAALIFHFREPIVEFFGHTLPRVLLAAVKALPHLLGEALGGLAAVVIATTAGIPALIIAGIINFGPGVAKAAARLGAQIVGGLVGGLGDIGGAVLGALAAIPGAVATAFGGLVGFLGRLPGLIASGLSSLPGLLAALPGQIASAVVGIVGSFAQLSVALPGIARSAASGALDELKALPGQVGDVFSGILGFITNLPFADVVGGVFGGIVGGFKDGWGTVNDITGGAIGDLVEFVRGLPGQILGLVGSIASAFVQVGASILKGIADGIGGAVDFIGDFAKGIGNGIIDFVNKNVLDRINDAVPNKIKMPGFLPDIDLPDKIVPTIPRLALGGIVDPTAGGTLVRLAEAGRKEAVLPLPDGLLEGLQSLAKTALTGGLGRSVNVTMVAPPERNAGREVVAELRAIELVA